MGHYLSEMDDYYQNNFDQTEPKKPMYGNYEDSNFDGEFDTQPEDDMLNSDEQGEDVAFTVEEVNGVIDASTSAGDEVVGASIILGGTFYGDAEQSKKFIQALDEFIKLHELDEVHIQVAVLLGEDEEVLPIFDRSQEDMGEGRDIVQDMLGHTFTIHEAFNEGENDGDDA